MLTLNAQLIDCQYVMKSFNLCCEVEKTAEVFQSMVSPALFNLAMGRTLPQPLVFSDLHFTVKPCKSISTNVVTRPTVSSAYDYSIGMYAVTSSSSLNKRIEEKQTVKFCQI